MGSVILSLTIFLLVFAAVGWRNLRAATYIILVCLPLYLVKFKFGPIPTTLLELMIYITVLVWLLRWLLKKAEINWLALRYYASPLLFIGMGLLLGLVVSTDKSLSLGIIKGWFFDPILLFALMTSTLSLRLHVKKAIVALMLPSVVLAAWAIYQVVTHRFITVDDRASAVFASANYLALFVVPIMVLALGLLHSAGRRLRWWVVAAWLVVAVGLYFTRSYAGWLGLLVGTAMFVLLTTRWWLAATGIVGAFAITVLSQWQHPKFQQMLDLVGRSSSHVRLQVWQTALLMIKENYLTGIGLGLFEQRYLEFAKRLFNPPIELRMLHSHNIILQFLVNTGLFGVLGFAWILLNFTYQGLRGLAAKRDPLRIAVISAMVALLTHGMLDLAYWKNDLSALFWVVVAFGIILSPPITHARN